MNISPAVYFPVSIAFRLNARLKEYNKGGADIDAFLESQLPFGGMLDWEAAVPPRPVEPHVQSQLPFGGMLDWESSTTLTSCFCTRRRLNCLSAECSIGSLMSAQTIASPMFLVSIAFRLNARLGGGVGRINHPSPAPRSQLPFGGMLDWETEAGARSAPGEGAGLNCLSAECSIGSRCGRSTTGEGLTEVSIAFRLNARLGGPSAFLGISMHVVSQLPFGGMLDWEHEHDDICRAHVPLRLNCLSAECSIGSHGEVQRRVAPRERVVSIAFRLNARLGVHKRGGVGGGGRESWSQLPFGGMLDWEFELLSELLVRRRHVSIAFRLNARLGVCG